MITKQITINGGSNQILPNATRSIQIFIGDEFLNQKSNTTASATNIAKQLGDDEESGEQGGMDADTDDG